MSGDMALRRVPRWDRMRMRTFEESQREWAERFGLCPGARLIALLAKPGDLYMDLRPIFRVPAGRRVVSYLEAIYYL